MKRHRIFISSVQKEFAEERKLMKRYISKNPAYRRFFDTFVFEEDVVAADRRTDEVYLEELGKCDIYLGLIGREYGFEDAEGVSPTEREFDEATRLGLKRLVFVLGKTDEDRHPKERAFLRRVSPEIVRSRCADERVLLSEIYASLDGLLVETGAYNFLPFDASPCEGAALKDISRTKIREFIVTAKMKRGLSLAQNTPVNVFLNHFHLLSPGGVPLNSAILLFGRDPQKWFLTSQVKCVQWPTSERCKPIKDHRIVQGTLFEMADAAVSFVLDKLEKWIGPRSTGVGAAAPTGFDIPYEVVKEAIVNGIAHRDYTSNASVQVEIFPDKLLVMSPGKPHPAVDVAHLDKPHSSNPVNPLIADALYLTGHIERIGTGLEDLFKVCRSAGLPRPEIEMFGGEFHLTVFRKKTNKKTNKKRANGTKIEQPLQVHLIGSSKLVLDAIMETPEISIAKLSLTTGLSVEGVRYQISKLKKAVGLAHIGPDKGGHWEVIGKAEN